MKKSSAQPQNSRSNPSSQRSTRWFGWPHAALYLLTVTLFCYLPALLPGRTFLPADLVMLIPPWSNHAHEIAPNWHFVARPTWDPLFWFYPMRKFLADSIHAGVVPWRNPYAFSGTPFIADGQSAFFYPINWLFAVFPIVSAFGIVAALHTFLSGLFFTLFARQRRLGWEASLAGATAWMLCGTMAAWQMWQVVDATLCWLPLGLYFIDRLIGEEANANNSSKRLCVGGLAVACGMMLLAGHLQFAFFGFTVMTAYAVFLGILHRAGGGALRVIGGFALGITLAAAQILPMLDLLKHSFHTDFSIRELLLTSLPASHLALLVMPEIAGGERNWITYPYSGAVNYYELTCYAGSAALLFAGFAFYVRARERRAIVLFWTGVAAFGLLVGCGSPLYAALYYGVPLFKSFHGVARTLALTEFAIAVLCAYGVQTFIEHGVDTVFRKYAARLAGGLALVVIALYGIIASRSSGMLPSLLTHEWLGYGLAQLGRSLMFILAAWLIASRFAQRMRWLAVAIVALDMLGFAAGLNPGADANMLYPNMPSVQQMRTAAGDGRVVCLGGNRRDLDRMIPNSAMSVGLRDASGSDPMGLGNYSQFLGALNTELTGSPAPNGGGIIARSGSPALAYLNVRAVISPVPLNDPSYTPVQGDDIYVYANPSAVGEARFAGSWIVDRGAQPWRRLLSAKPGSLVSVPEPPRFGGHTAIAAMPPHAGLGTVEQASAGLERASAVATTPAPDILVFSEIADPAWKASVDGRSADWLVVDGLFVGLPLTQGTHHVSLAYRPESGAMGLYLTCIGWLIASYLLGSALARLPVRK